MSRGSPTDHCRTRSRSPVRNRTRCFCELVAPDGSTWRYGPPDADSTITGSAGAFCRVGARRLAPGDSGLVATGPHGATVLRVLRNYAG